VRQTIKIITNRRYSEASALFRGGILLDGGEGRSSGHDCFNFESILIMLNDQNAGKLAVVTGFA
jgi:hypothetical protein